MPYIVVKMRHGEDFIVDLPRVNEEIKDRFVKVFGEERVNMLSDDDILPHTKITNREKCIESLRRTSLFVEAKYDYSQLVKCLEKEGDEHDE